MIPELSTNPLGPRIVQLFDEDNEGYINFRTFLARMSVFSSHASREEKMAFLFRVWDTDGDGYISDSDMSVTLKMMTGNKLPAKALAELVSHTLRLADVDRDGKLTQHEFEMAMEGSSIGNTLCIPMVASDDMGAPVTQHAPLSPSPRSGYMPSTSCMPAAGAGNAGASSGLTAFKLNLPPLAKSDDGLDVPRVVESGK
jgi:serine/threonine-protein phosphatase 2B regulatory subunit